MYAGRSALSIDVQKKGGCPFGAQKDEGRAATILLLRGCVVRCFEEYLEMGTPWMARAGAPDAVGTLGKGGV